MHPDEYARMFSLEDHYWWFVARRSLALGLLRRFGPPPGEGSVLDLGCGTGAVLRELDRDWPAVGFDFSSEALRFCRSRGLPRLVRGDAQTLPFRDESFGAVVGLDLYEHLEFDETALRETWRVLRPGGALVLSVPAFPWLWGPHDVALMHFRRYRRAEVAARLRSAGFEVSLCTYSVFLLFPVVAAIRFFEKRRRGPAEASLPPLPPWANRGLIGLQRFEAALIRRMPLPFGSSVVAVGRRP